MRNHLHPLMKRRRSRNNEKTLSRSSGWVSDLGPWSGLSNRVIRGLNLGLGWERVVLRRDCLK